MTASPVPTSQQVQRVLARFEVGCPALRDFQVAVQIDARESELVLLPAAKVPKGRIEFVFTARGLLRTCMLPPTLTQGQRAAVSDLAWAIREALRAPTATESIPPTSA